MDETYMKVRGRQLTLKCPLSKICDKTVYTGHGETCMICSPYRS